MRKSARKHFELYVEPEPMSGCHIWLGRRMNGYGVLKVLGREVRAHRFSYQLQHGEVPSSAMVLHRCDQPWCVNPSHLFLGTHADNMADRRVKNRQARGESHGRAKLTSEQVAEIRRRLSQGMRQVVLAAQYGIDQTTISAIKIGKRWSWQR